MRAALLTNGSNDLVIDDITIGEVGPHEVIVRIEACGLCHSDYHYMDGTLDRGRPYVLGHEAVGVVEQIGSAVEMHKIGDRVVTCLVAGCGNCKACRRSQPAMCLNPLATRRSSAQPARLTTSDGTTIGAMGGVGALADQVLVDERGLIGIPHDVPAHLAAILGCAVITGLGAALNVADVRAGETVAIIGLGGVGLNVLQGARIAGAARIIAIDMSDDKLARAATLGATDLVNPANGDPVAAVRALEPDGVDHAFEVVGKPVLAAQAYEMVRMGGSAYVVGVMPDDARIEISAMGMRRGKQLKGVFMGGGDPQVDIPKAVELWRRGLLDLDSMVSRTLPLEQVNDGFAALVAGEVARAVVVM